ncbi:G-patch domain and KOW motifs-containing protein homolog 1-like [Chrysoperla carnea]|uniref:G-patch domain and KOW motifs-containing protein homolog 1-like n=1 Tax=Chrysoperla carnea TaxID=189513 RepID=UPI001D07117F|nr:G-patch domain and KOW motifs-containing protein homolog 1-like [Chrysoperla carnea]
MSNEEKKFSFSFTKQLKKSNIVNSDNKEDTKTENIQLIDCVEENSIKVIGSENEIKKEPLVIPLSKNTKKIPVSEDPIIITSENSTTQKSLEDIAVQELINESKNITTNKAAPLVHTIPKLSENGEIAGEPESTLDDYENVPISEFGFAMLRGMGWKDGEENGNNPKTAHQMPAVRPKGMGLGADKLRTDKNSTKSQATNNGEQLKIIKNAYVKIISGRYNNMLGQVQGFDDDAGSIIIKLALTGNVVSLQEFLVEPITKSEYDKNSKVINLQKYEEYGKKDKKNLETDKHKNLDPNEYESKPYKKHSKYDSDSEDSDISKSNRKQDKHSKRYSDKNDKREKNHSKSNSENDLKYSRNKNSSDSDSEYEYKNHRKNKYRDDRYDSKYKRNDDDTDSYRNRSRNYDKYDKYSRDKYTDSNSSKSSKHKSSRDYDDSYKYKKSSSSKSRRSRSR